MTEREITLETITQTDLDALLAVAQAAQRTLDLLGSPFAPSEPNTTTISAIDVHAVLATLAESLAALEAGQ